MCNSITMLKVAPYTSMKRFIYTLIFILAAWSASAQWRPQPYKMQFSGVKPDSLLILPKLSYTGLLLEDGAIRYSGGVAQLYKSPSWFEFIYSGGTYSNPSWLTGLAWSKLSGTPTTLAGYGIADAIQNQNASAQAANAWISGDYKSSSGLVLDNGTTSASYTVGAGFSVFGTATSHPIVFQTGGTDRGRFAPSGNLLINTSIDDVGVIQANGSAKMFSSAMDNTLFLGLSSAHPELIATDAGVTAFKPLGVKSLSTLISDNFGVLPAHESGYPLIVNGVVKSFGGFRATDGIIIGQMSVNDITSGILEMGTVSNHDLTVLTDGLERIRVLKTGETGFGESAPTATLHVKGISASTGAALIIQNSASATVLQVANNGEVIVNGVKYVNGAGSPEGVVTAPAGSVYTNKSGGAGTTLYIKESGSGNTGWVAK